MGTTPPGVVPMFSLVGLVHGQGVAPRDFKSRSTRPVHKLLARSPKAVGAVMACGEGQNTPNVGERLVGSYREIGMEPFR